MVADTLDDVGCQAVPGDVSGVTFELEIRDMIGPKDVPRIDPDATHPMPFHAGHQDQDFGEVPNEELRLLGLGLMVASVVEQINQALHLKATGFGGRLRIQRVLPGVVSCK